MRREVEIRLAPDAIEDARAITAAAARACGWVAADVTATTVLRRAVDARHDPVRWVLRVAVWCREQPPLESTSGPPPRDVSGARPVAVVGSGPAGLFAALALIEAGLRPVVLERGRDVRMRRHDVARINREGDVDPDSNYAFGEGGAGTFSDGKLYTRADKRGSVRRVLETLVAHGAPPEIRIDAHPHIGTNRLPQVVQALRRTIVASGGEVRFATRVVDLRLHQGRCEGVVLADGSEVPAAATVLATGHSARDVWAMLHRRGLALEPKPFAVGVRVEHPQRLVDAMQYRRSPRPAGLPPASYALVRRAGGRGVFSFCMCPGGIICPAATAADEVVVNGWSPSSRGSRFANSGIVVEIDPAALSLGTDSDRLWAGVELQRQLEGRAARAGGGHQVAPAQRLVDFVGGRTTRDLPECSYPPGIVAADLVSVLGSELAAPLREGLAGFAQRMDGWLGAEAVVLGVETRTSAPIRVPRDASSLQHPQATGLYPCGEGAGWAGGITSAALDGDRVARAVATWLGAD